LQEVKKRVASFHVSGMRRAMLWSVSLLAKPSGVIVYLKRKAAGNLRSPAICLHPREGHRSYSVLWKSRKLQQPIRVVMKNSFQIFSRQKWTNLF